MNRASKRQTQMAESKKNSIILKKIGYFIDRSDRRILSGVSSRAK